MQTSTMHRSGHDEGVQLNAAERIAINGSECGNPNYPDCIKAVIRAMRTA
jgi:hypothetical protein